MLMAYIGPGVGISVSFFWGWIPTSIWWWITLLIGLVWLKRHIDLLRGKQEPVLRPDEAGVKDAELPRLTVLVAAKDEEKNIDRCLDGLLTQQYPGLQVIAIDDRSQDATGQILDEYEKSDVRFKAVHIQELTPGWFGKNHAMNAGIQQASGEWFCLTDADCVFESTDLLVAAMRYALREKVDFLSVLPRLEAGTFWERVIQPVAGAIMVFWFPPQKVNSDRSLRAYANGAFMLMPRKTYHTIGGHERVKATLNEDMHMARLVKENGLRLRVIRGGEMYHVRMYVGFKQIWRGWSRIFYGCFGTFGRLLVSVLMLSIFSVSPYLTLLLSPLAGENWGMYAVVSSFAILAQQSILWPFYAISGTRPAWALTYPIGASICLGMTLNAMGRLGGLVATTWRGTTYRGGSRTNS